MRTLQFASLVFAQCLLSTVTLAQASSPAADGVTLRLEADVVIPPPPINAAPSVYVAPPQDEMTPVSSPYAPSQSAQPYSLAAPEMRVEHRMNRGLAVAGGVMFGVSWAVNILGAGLGTLLLYSGSTTHAGLTSDQTFGASFIPVIGPLIFAGVALDASSSGVAFAVLGIVDAAAQAAGLTMLIIGIVGEDVEVNVNEQTALLVLPYTNGEGTGLTVSGTF